MPLREDPDTAELRGALRGGCERAWTAIYERYNPLLIAYGRFACGFRDRYDVESIVGGVWLSTWIRRDELDGDIFLPYRFHGYLQLGVLNRIRDQSRRDQFRQERPMASYAKMLGHSEGDDDDITRLFDVIGGTIESAPDPAEVFARLETAEQVRDILKHINGKHVWGNERTALVLLLVNGHRMPYAEAVACLGLSKGVFRSRLFRARQSFKHQWIARYGVPA